MAAQTDPLASGISTSEGKLTIAICLVGAALEAFGGVLSQQLDAHPSVLWLGIASLVTGAAVQVLSLLGYTKNRSILKSNAIVQALDAGVPMAVAAISQALFKNLKDPNPATLAAGAAQQTLNTQRATVGSASLVSSTAPTPVETPRVKPSP